MADNDKKYLKATVKGIEERDKIADDEEKDAGRTVKDAGKETGNFIKSINQNAWNQARIPEILNQTSSIMGQMQEQLNKKIIFSISSMMEFAADKIDFLLPLLGISLSNVPIQKNFVDAQKILIYESIKGLTQENIRRLNNVIITGIQGGKSTAMVANEIKDTFKLSLSRANTISRTETLRIHEHTSFERELAAYNQDKSLRKEWNENFKPNARQSHIAANNEYHRNPIAVDRFFIIDGEKLLYPRDMRASAKNTVHCSCFTTLVKKR